MMKNKILGWITLDLKSTRSHPKEQQKNACVGIRGCKQSGGAEWVYVTEFGRRERGARRVFARISPLAGIFGARGLSG